MSLADTILHNVAKLAPFPVVLEKAIHLINDPNSSTQDVVDVIQFDQSITASVLKICNSAYFGLRRTIHSLREALVMIGFNQLLEIILGQESVHLFSGPCKGYDLEVGELWRHSVGCALLSRIVSKRLNRETNFTHFTSALLHDIGKVTLSQFVEDYFGEIQRLVREDHRTFTEAEKEVLGIDHAELGGKIAEAWNFPKNIVAAIRYHHTPFLTSEDHEMVQLVYLCDLVAIVTGIGGGADGLAYHPCKEVLNQYDLKERDIEIFIVELNDRLQLVKEILRVNN
jgi:putative nucleotidyltransferase with HDIG domain